MIKLPVRYDSKQMVIRHGEFGQVLCEFPTGLIFKDKDVETVEAQISETANEIVTAINSHARLVTENAALKAELEAYRELAILAFNELQCTCSDETCYACRFYDKFQAIQEKTK